MHLARKLAAALLAAGLAITPALAADPTGNWQSSDGDARYTVSFCGDGTQLCARLSWLSAEARTAENLAYLNRYVVEGAVPAGNDSWRGNVAYEGDTYAGSVTLVSNDAMRLKGCKGMFCQSMSFVRL